MRNKNILFVLCVIFISIGLISVNHIISQQGNTVNIYYNSELYKSLPLDIDCEINVNGTNIVIIENSAVFMKDANCPDKLCVHQGRIFDSSKNIICLPNKIVVSIDKKSKVDGTVR